MRLRFLAIFALLSSFQAQANTLEDAWWPNSIKLFDAWKIVAHAKDITVAVVDIDFDTQEPHLTESFDLTQGIDFWGHGWNKFSDWGPTHHGTLVSGLIGANKINKDNYSGVAPGVRMLPFNWNFEDLSFNSLLNIFYVAADSGAQIINCSCAAQNLTQKQIEDLKIFLIYAQSKNILIVVAAGNENQLLDSKPSYPASLSADFDNLISVGASNISDTKSFLSNFSKKYVDVFAPGEDILVIPNIGKLQLSSGTSEATPIVTGIAALLLQHRPTLKAKELKKAILDSVDTFPAYKEFAKSGGRINALKALELISATH